MIGVFLGVFGCNSLDLPPLADGPRLVATTVRVVAEVDATLPMDLDRLPDGGFVVLDGAAGRLHRFDPEGAPEGVLEHPGLHGAVRLDLPSQGEGYWVADPEAGEVRRLSPDGTIERVLNVAGAVDVLDQASTLVVGTRGGEVVFVSPTGEGPPTVVARDVDDLPMGPIAAVLGTPDGQLLAVDTLGHEVHRFDGNRVPVGRTGRSGLWIGTLAKPKGAAITPGGALAVVDSALRAVQLFEPDGTPLGALGADEPWQSPHPVQVVPHGEELWVLDAEQATVYALTVTPEALAEARARAALRHLRTPLVDADTVRAKAGEARLCIQCHDGVVNDDRYVWDEALHHHPVGVAPELAVPEFFPLDEAGQIRCGTCHSPHGTSTLAEAQGVEGEADRAHLVRHRGTEGDQFTRLSRADAELCVGCHSDAAHDSVLEQLGLEGTAHPVGRALARALAKRAETDARSTLPPGIDGTCTTCHTPHGATRDKLGRDDTAGATCLACHDEAVGRRSHPLDDEGCQSCHDLVGGTDAGLVRRPEDGGGLCASCHDDGPTTAHARLDGACASCHAPHQSKGVALARFAARDADPGACTACHETTAQQGHPVGVATTDGALTCASCHEAHDPVPVTEGCESCHEAAATAAQRGEGHGGLACVACHGPHEAAATSRLATNPADGMCLTCHGPRGSATRIRAWTHEAPVFGGQGPRWEPLRSLALYRPDGSVAAADEGGELACISCHAVHGPDAGRPDLNHDGWQGPCGACHGDETEWRYRDYHHPTKRSERPQ